MCRVCVFIGERLSKYSFPDGHPLSSKRVERFFRLLEDARLENVDKCSPVLAHEEAILLFHLPEYVEFVKKASSLGTGYLDYGDTPAFPGVFEASSYVVGATLLGLDKVMRGESHHAFNPVGGLHHARRGRAGGFCVFNDAAIAISCAKKTYGLERILYVDIDAHHGDGVFYEFYDDPLVFIADIHEDGRYLYPGTGFAHETGSGNAAGTKMNIPLLPGSSDDEFTAAFSLVESFAERAKPELIIFQCGADGLSGDPLTHLQYSVKSHEFAARRLHSLAHSLCQGRLLALGGGGYNADRTARAWLEVVRVLTG